ncbi:unnamed protein product [Effrenium voratum]|uniref:Uncharacterized protein n=1 Tax=Effrenium voratum TaxID=2562239 RepID=A0AA36MPA4_9DINO|nr:unnamed protein product [Effrenium voratum]CAJ1375330.1 unnamed protein product [Effrenium voratum]CAJ1452938.1 unnamed protein product [Effrenium voratum]|mmetsp:Transcript_12102/g.28684  ORF Transcript_12102/g.28684 Transcript_12102/m.28684 type:complete len:354 (+) Transcript_12102:41-1102(+)
MALILASIALVVATMMGMVAAAVLAYCCWNGALWIFSPHDEGFTVGHVQRASDGFNVQEAKTPRFPQQYAAGSERMAQNQQLMWDPNACFANYGASIRREQRGAGMGIDAFRQSVDMAQTLPSPALSIAEAASPQPRAQARKMHRTSNSVSVAEQVQRGYAAQLAIRFSGDLAYHMGNVRAIADAYGLDSADMCYCFLCLDAAKGCGLALKKWGTGTYAARIWTVSLARFVKTAQRVRSAKDESKFELLCGEWRYNQDHFIREVQACEIPFHRENGKALLNAFQTEEIRKVEVSRAQQILLQHADAAPSRGQHQLSLPETDWLREEGQAHCKRALKDEMGAVALPRKRMRQSG